MIPVILVAPGARAIDKFLGEYQKKEGILDSHVMRIEPEGKEFGIAQVKALSREMAYGAAASRLYVLYDFDTASAEAQNAFLKTLEEHPASVGFVMVVAHRHALLPTIVSRSRLVDMSTSSSYDEKIMTYFESMIKRPEEAKIGDDLLDVGSEAARRRVFTTLLVFFKSRLATDSYAPAVLTEALRTFSLVSKNNVNAQMAIDHLLFFIKKTYSKAGLDAFDRAQHQPLRA
jgi:hypothetical protein